MRRSGLVFTLLLLAGCAATPYQAVDRRGFGYQDQRIAAGVYDVMFVADTATGVQQVQDFTLLHAAELGAVQGYAYLSVTSTRAGTVMLGADDRGHIPASGYAAYMQPQMGMSGNGMTGNGMNGRGGSYSSTGNNLTSLAAATSRSGGDPARACVLRVQFYKQEDTGRGAAAQEIAPLLSRLHAEYSLSAAAGH